MVDIFKHGKLKIVDKKFKSEINNNLNIDKIINYMEWLKNYITLFFEYISVFFIANKIRYL